jgi:hypothetical protein
MLTISHEFSLIITLTELDLTAALKHEVILSIFVITIEIIIEISSQYYFEIVTFVTNVNGVV